MSFLRRIFFEIAPLDTTPLDVRSFTRAYSRTIANFIARQFEARIERGVLRVCECELRNANNIQSARERRRSRIPTALAIDRSRVLTIPFPADRRRGEFAKLGIQKFRRCARRARASLRVFIVNLSRPTFSFSLFLYTRV